MRRPLLVSAAVAAAIVLAGCGASDPPHSSGASSPSSTRGTDPAGGGSPTAIPAGLPGMPPVLDPSNVYAADAPGNFTRAARAARPLVYVPDTISNDVYVIDPTTYKVVGHFPVGKEPQHVVPSYDMTTLWATSDAGNTLTPIDPRTGKPGRPVPVDDPYNMYFTPDGRYAVVVAERNRRLDFHDAKTMRLVHELAVPQCPGVDHADFSADGRYLVATCEFAGQQDQPGRLIKVDVAAQTVVGTLELPAGAMPQDIKLSPDGSVYYVADMMRGGVYVVSASADLPLRLLGFIPTGKGTHGLYVSRNDKDLYITNRGEGSVSVLDFATRKLVAKWVIPGGGSPDMGNVSADGRVLWLSGRWNDVVYAIDTQTGKLLAKIPVGRGPHGVCVWPQPGRYSLGHTGITR